MLEVTSYPAKQGDAIWIRWGDSDAPRTMIIDMGTEAIGRSMRPRLEALASAGLPVDLLVITHVDADHIGGVLTSLAEADPIDGLTVSDVWFNGFAHLKGEKVRTRTDLEAMGPAQGERLSRWLRAQTWNEAFDGGPVRVSDASALPTHRFHDGLTLTVLGPTTARLERFVPTWKETVEEALERGSLLPDLDGTGLETLGTSVPPALDTEDDLLELATRERRKDSSRANGSSIALLLEYDGARVLLAGDAFSSDLNEVIDVLSPGEPLRLDLFKLAHHGSKGSTTRELIERVECSTWLFSTDGARFRHPDPEVVAGVLAFGRRDDPLLAFNVRSRFNRWWDNEEWKDRFGYSVAYGDDEVGLTVPLSACAR